MAPGIRKSDCCSKLLVFWDLTSTVKRLGPDNKRIKYALSRCPGGVSVQLSTVPGISQLFTHLTSQFVESWLPLFIVHIHSFCPYTVWIANQQIMFHVFHAASFNQCTCLWGRAASGARKTVSRVSQSHRATSLQGSGYEAVQSPISCRTSIPEISLNWRLPVTTSAVLSTWFNWTNRSLHVVNWVSITWQCQMYQANHDQHARS